MFQFYERPDSRAFTFDPPSYTGRWKASGEQDNQIVYNYALFGTPQFVTTPAGILYRQDIRVDPDGYAQYEVTVPYGPAKTVTGSYNWSFDTTGATVHITAAKEHIKSYPVDAQNEDPHECTIGVANAGSSPEGTDIIIPALKFSVSFRFPASIVGLDYARTLARATGKTNDGGFLGFDEGELLFLGGTGSDGSEAESQVDFHFVASENVTNLKFGEIINIVKKGHHYAWVEHIGATTDTDEPATRPKRVHIERVYDAINYAEAFGWS